MVQVLLLLVLLIIITLCDNLSNDAACSDLFSVILCIVRLVVRRSCHVK